MKLYATIDFYDEMLYSAWNPEMLFKYFTLMKSKGISRIYWIDQKEIMKYSGNKSHFKHIQQTWENFNAELHQKAVELAHKAGLEIFVIIKPYELGIPTAQLSEDTNCEAFEVVGGRIYHILDFALKHPDVLLKRCVYPTAKAEKFIITFKEAAQSDGILNVYASSSNKNYAKIAEMQICTGTISVEIPVAEFEYYCFTLEKCHGANCIKDIICAVDNHGNRVPISLAILPYHLPHNARFHMDSWQAGKDNKDFLENGLVFDYLPGIPSGLFSPEFNAAREYDFASPETPALGVSLKLNSVVATFPDPENKIFNDFIANWVKEDLSYGFDGVEIRLTGHSSPVFWEEYGSMRDTRIRRGIAYKKMLIVLSEITRKANKKFGVHIPNLMFDSAPDKSSPMEFYWDYCSWIKEKIMDEITAKLVRADGFSAKSLEMLDLSKKYGIPVNYCPFLHGIKNPAEYAKRAAAYGVDAFNIYESATMWKEYKNGRFIEYDIEKARNIWTIPEI